MIWNEEDSTRALQLSSEQRFDDEDLLQAAGADLVVKALDQVEVEALLAGQLQRAR